MPVQAQQLWACIELNERGAGLLTHELIAAAAVRVLDVAAVHFGHQQLSYAELQSRSNRLARELRSSGVGRGALVGLCVERSPNMVVAQLAILQSGAAYVPLDPAYPAQRLAYMATDADMALLVTESSLSDLLDWPHSLLLDLDAASIASRSGAPLSPDATLDARADDPAYVIYTSGSTGQPKGVVVPHRAVVNFLTSMAREPGMRASTTCCGRARSITRLSRTCRATCARSAAATSRQTLNAEGRAS